MAVDLHLREKIYAGAERARERCERERERKSTTAMSGAGDRGIKLGNS